MHRAVPRHRPCAAGSLLERLERRTLLSLNDFPDIADLLSPSDTVVRLQTNFGDIDLELFDQTVPATVANFLDYIRDGDYDKTFFHRLARTPQDEPFLLQGGAFRLHGPMTTGPFNGAPPEMQAWESIPVDPAIANQFNQPNLARTVAMARVPGQANSATSQFYINLQDNPLLDTVDGGFTVFARIATDESWAIVQAIISGTTLSDQGGEFTELPTKTASAFDGTDVTEEQLVTIRDVEIIKPQGGEGFYTHRVYYPEGFAGSNINEFLPLGNPGGPTLQYQVIVRAETRDAIPADGSDFWYRDKVIASGQIGSIRRAGITVSTFANPANNLVPRQGKPYAIEVWSTAPVSATLSHYDFGASAIENFTQSPSTTWTIPDIRRGTDIRDFVVWTNTGETPASITLSFHSSDGGAPIVINTTTEAFRRGGLSIGDAGELADGDFSLQITSDTPLVAAVSHYKTTGADRGGATQLAIPGTGSSSGVLPLASNGSTGSGVADTVTFFNPGAGAAAITLIAKFSDGSPDFTWNPAALMLNAGGRASYTIEDFTELRGKSFTLLYSSAGQSVFATTLHVEHDDVATSAFAYSASTRHGFGEGFMNAQRAGADLFEKLAIYNPNGSTLFSGTAQPSLVTVRFLFTDGTSISDQFLIDSDENLILDLTTYTPLLQQSANSRYYYSIDITADVAVVAGMSHYDTSLGGLQPSGGGLTNGAEQDGATPLDTLPVAPLWLQLRIVPQTGGFGPGSPLTTAGPVNGPVSLGTTPQTRLMRFRVDYRIQDLDLNDNIHPAGLSVAELNIVGAGTGTTSDTTVSRATISAYENFPGAAPPPGPTDTGFDGNTGDDATAADANGRAGLVGPFRNGMPDQNDNNYPTNGTISGLSINRITPLTLTQTSQGLIGFDDTSGNPAFPLTGDEWYPLYVFMITAGEDSAGSVVFSASFPSDSNTGAAFGYFSDGLSVFRTSRLAYSASITVNIPAV
ncbi:MAG: peptidylprolyl isomerase [Phycisphaerales bacterium]|nr:peptidylprolyl isomerase [Phycisphaerales bacterium]